MISFRSEDLLFEKGKTNDWLLSNRIGGYASSTIIGLNTRKYHGLLIGSDQNLTRTLYLSKIEDSAVIGEEEFPLSVNQYPEGVIHPDGHKRLRLFEFSDVAKFVYYVEGLEIQKTIMVVTGENTVVINYRLEGSRKPGSFLKLRPLINIRDVNSNTQREIDYSVKRIGNGFFVMRPKVLYVISDLASYKEEPLTYYNMVYERERERETGELDNHYSPGYFLCSCEKNEMNIIASTEEINFERIKKRLSQEAKRKIEMLERYYKETGFSKNVFATSLVLAADSFVIEREGKKAIIAGYHWFSEWSRDALLSLPGLLLSTYRYNEASEVLESIANRMKGGSIPNIFGSDAPNADSPLLFINAVYLYLKKTGDFGFVKDKMWKKMKEAITWYLTANEFCEVDKEDGLLKTKKPGLTWMDAKGQSGFFNPRVGKPVEINALWFNAAMIMSELAETFEPSVKEEFSALAEKIKKGFQKFWNPAKRALFDMIEPADAATRPNQIFAVSLPFSPLSHEQQRGVFAKVFRSLYTPLGLRSLSPSDPQYKEVYSGNQEERDAAYHNGTIWPYLLGAFFDAHRRVFKRVEAGAIELVEPFEDNLRKYGVGTVNEIFEAKTLRPDGCISQAWSVAEILRVYTTVKKDGIHWF
ncbi:MAG: amylo-alpha-1,6-glucosidase [Candidatus Anstonellales archaeon]